VVQVLRQTEFVRSSVLHNAEQWWALPTAHRFLHSLYFRVMAQGLAVRAESLCLERRLMALAEQLQVAQRPGPVAGPVTEGEREGSRAFRRREREGGEGGERGRERER
jgi:hypothetical protein